MWREVAARLRAAGHEVYAPTLTGLGERVHLATTDIGLDTHIQDVVNVLAYEELRDVVLVGHSYSGMVITGVARQAAERLAHLVYLDAFVPEPGRSLFDLWDSAVRDEMLERARAAGEGWRVPHNPPDADRRTDQPLKTFTQPLALGDEGRTAFPRTVIFCSDKPGRPIFAPIAAAAERARDAGWGYHELPTGHMAMWTMPQKLAGILDTLGGGQTST